jgi:FkbM family methyltransferase
MFLRGLVGRIARRTPYYFRPNVLTPWTVRWAYRLLLDREPEDKAVVRAKLRGPASTSADLRQELIYSGEFAEKNPDLAPFPPGTIVVKELSCGRRLYVDLGDTVIGARITRDDYDSDVVALLPKLIEPGTTVIDVGANIGFFTIHMAHVVAPTGQVGVNGRVIAFEPIAELAALLSKSIAENALDSIITVETSAVGAARGHAEILYVHDARNQGASYLVSGDAAECRTAHEVRRVPLVALDEYRLPSRVSFIKLDVEGAEPLCITGARGLLEHDRPVVLTEVHPVQLRRVSNASPNDYLDQLRASEYRCFAFADARFDELSRDALVERVITVLAVPSEHPHARHLSRGPL